MNFVQCSDDYSRSTATNTLWYRNMGTGAVNSNELADAKVILPGNDSSGFTDVTTLIGSNFRSEVKFNNQRNPSTT